jgi:hypothetical protein
MHTSSTDYKSLEYIQDITSDTLEITLHRKEEPISEHGFARLQIVMERFID